MDFIKMTPPWLRFLVVRHEVAQDMTALTIQRIVKQVANKAESPKPVPAHVLRHTFSFDYIEKEISTRVLMALLGPDRLATTEIYLNLSPEDAIREFQNKW